ncbi:MAG: threonine aldolase family protein [Phycisphaerales bacterium JB040]
MADASTIDLRSDTVTHPTPAMREAMMASPLGDDVLGDDPTVKELERVFAELVGTEDACYVASGTMANQTAIRAHTEPGDELIADATCHISHYETAAPAALSGVQIRFLDGERGIYTPEQMTAAIRGEADYLPRTRLVWLENTCNGGGGSVWPLERARAVADAARARGLRVHLDGARLWHAAIASAGADGWRRSMREYVSAVDSVSCCFSKGLGCPAGSIVGGNAEVIHRVRRFKKMFGGSMRQAGLLAGACLYAMEHHVERLEEDHAKARVIAEGVDGVGPYSVDLAGVATNIVNVRVDPGFCSGPELQGRLEAAGVRLFALSNEAVRVVTHLDVSMEECERAVQVFREVAEG